MWQLNIVYRASLSDSDAELWCHDTVAVDVEARAEPALLALNDAFLNEMQTGVK